MVASARTMPRSGSSSPQLDLAILENGQYNKENWSGIHMLPEHLR